MKLILACLLFAWHAHAVETFFGQANQDRFVYLILYKLLGKQDSGTYLEIGAGQPVAINNTYFFEKNFQWKGVSIDHGMYEVSWDSVRSNPLLNVDATQCDYEAILSDFPREIDYLSLDVDGPYIEVLQKLPLQTRVFKVITIEHDFYRFQDLYRTREREILTAAGYYLLCSNVQSGGCPFEDWWIHPSIVSENLWPALTSLDLHDKEYTQILQALQDLHLN